MTISAKIIADSLNEHNGIRLTTMEIKYPRFILAEFNTHRMFSRNSASSRAIPVQKQIDAILADTAMPIHWGKNQPGMQADEECSAAIGLPGFDSYSTGYTAQEAWEYARANTIEVAQAFNAAGYHKQIVNRLLEPFMHMITCVTATDWTNFYALRDHKDAQPEIRELAHQMKLVHYSSEPKLLYEGDWHLPYLRDEDIIDYDCNLEDYSYHEKEARISAARCARTSYKTVEGKVPTVDEDMKLWDRLMSNEIKHASPAEHPAMAVKDPGYIGNFRGWKQLRKFIPNETL